MRISSSSDTLSSLNTLSRNRAAQQSTLKRLSTGKRINTGADDPAGLIAATSLQSSLAANQAAIAGAQRTSLTANAADGVVGQVSGMLGDIRALQLANSGSTVSASEKAANQLQIDSLLTSVDRLSGSATFNGRMLTNGTMTLQSGTASTTIPKMNTASIGTTTVGADTYTLADLRTGGRLSSASGNSALADQVVTQAIGDVATARGAIGAFQANDIESTIASLTATSINMSSSLSYIQDTDYATEFTKLMQQSTVYKANVLMLKKAQERTGSVLSILG